MDVAQAEQSPISCALLVAKTIEDPTERSKAMASIAGTLAEAGQREQALQLLSEAREVARIKPWPDLRLWCAIAGKYAEAGQQEQASRILAETLITAQTVNRIYDDMKQNGLWVLPDIAIQYAKIGEFDQALQTADGIKKPARDRIKAWIGIAGEYAKAGQKEQAAQLLSVALEAAKMFAEEESVYEKSKPFTDIAGVYTQIGQKEQATLVLSQALKKAMTIPDSGNKLEALAGIAINHAKNGEFNQAHEVVNSIEGLRPHDRCMVLAEIAGGYAKAGQKDQAMLLLSQALEEAKTYEDEELEDEVLSAFAVNYAQAGDFDQAIKMARAIKSDAYGKCEALAEIAVGHAEHGQEEQAIKLLSEVLKIAMTLPSGEHLSRELVKIAGRYIEIKEVNKASQLLSQALEKAKEIKDADDKPFAYAYLAQMHGKLGQNDQASKLLSQALKAATTIEDASWKSFMLTEIARKYAEAGQKEQASLVLSQAIETARTIESVTSKSLELSFISGDYAEAGDFIQALEIARTIEDAKWKSSALSDIACRIAQLSEKDQDILLDITRAMKPLGPSTK